MLNDKRLFKYKDNMNSINNTWHELFDLYLDINEDDIPEVIESLDSIVEHIQNIKRAIES